MLNPSDYVGVSFWLLSAAMVAATFFFWVERDRAVGKWKTSLTVAAMVTGIAAIQERLGVADFSAAYSQNEKTVKVLYYRTQRKHKDGLTTKDECTYLQFSNGELIATGHGDEFKK